jgi:3-mercaptopyruvate sulfurtransferase SseA
MERIRPFLWAILIVGLAASACTAPPTQSVEPVFTQTPDNLPRTQDEVPRVTPEEAKAALDSGAAIIVDVRDPALYEKSHVAGAISIWLDEIEGNPTGLSLNKDQWIITYCT